MRVNDRGQRYVRFCCRKENTEQRNPFSKTENARKLFRTHGALYLALPISRGLRLDKQLNIYPYPAGRDWRLDPPAGGSVPLGTASTRFEDLSERVRGVEGGELGVSRKDFDRILCQQPTAEDS